MTQPTFTVWRVLMSSLMIALAAPVVAAPTQLEAARDCVREPARLDRLACFDRVFRTPLNRSPVPAAAPSPRSPDWRLAYALETQRQPGDGALYRNAGVRGGQLVTIAALGAVPPRPLLAVQCQNNITELKLMLPQALNRDRVPLTFVTAGGREQQLWRVRDQGLVVSGGRGLPAIRTVKRLAGGQQLQLSSPEARLDGLVFDLAGLTTQLKPLRKACGW